MDKSFLHDNWDAAFAGKKVPIPVKRDLQSTLSQGMCGCMHVCCDLVTMFVPFGFCACVRVLGLAPCWVTATTDGNTIETWSGIMRSKATTVRQVLSNMRSLVLLGYEVSDIESYLAERDLDLQTLRTARQAVKSMFDKVSACRHLPERSLLAFSLAVVILTLFSFQFFVPSLHLFFLSVSVPVFSPNVPVVSLIPPVPRRC